ncbi:MAG: insulinase family protein [Thermodesulfovibrionales bacterium]|nr:insulinase family protein [Thermodesulfovibrionales bacterium]
MFKKEHLSNGVPVVMEALKNMRSVVVGLWVKVGSRNEPSEKNGISHFLEHMFFKGTRKRTAKDIAFETDSLGGELNAFTSRETTTFYIKVLDEFLEKGLELLSDVFLNSLFPEEDIEKEKKIIKEEIKMVEDTPDDYIHDLFNQTIWGHSGIGQPVLGRRETIRIFTRDDLMAHIRKYYGVKDIVISCAGNFDHMHLMALLNKNLGNLRRGSEPERGAPPGFQSTMHVFSKQLSEAHLCLGFKGIHHASKDRYSLFTLNTILGAGVSSRLFQEIREKRGLAYAIYSFIASYSDTGLWGIYAGVSRKKVREVIELILQEMHHLKDTITESELQRAKNQLKGNIILGLESTSSRMNNIARQEIYHGRYFSPKEIMDEVDSITLKQIKDLAELIIRKDLLALTIYGPVQEESLKGILDEKGP